MKHFPYYIIVMLLAFTACSKDDDPVAPEQNKPPQYTPNVIFISFEDGYIDKNMLCSPDKPSADEKEALAAERYSIEALVQTPDMQQALREANGVQFRRIHTFNPCGDSTYTINNGPALPIVFFHYIALELEEKNGAANDLVAICNTLKTQHAYGIKDATPNFFAVAH